MLLSETQPNINETTLSHMYNVHVANIVTVLMDCFVCKSVYMDVAYLTSVRLYFIRTIMIGVDIYFHRHLPQLSLLVKF